jgi:hypothetical protein
VNALLLALLVGCAEEDTDAPGLGDTAADRDTAIVEDGDWDCVPDEAVTWGGFADGFFTTYCRACHSVDTPDRRGAPAGVDFDTRSDVLRQSGRVRARALEARTMPLGGGVVEDDLILLEGWLCAQAGR